MRREGRVEQNFSLQFGFDIEESWQLGLHQQYTTTTVSCIFTTLMKRLVTFSMLTLIFELLHMFSKDFIKEIMIDSPVNISLR